MSDKTWKDLDQNVQNEMFNHFVKGVLTDIREGLQQVYVDRCNEVVRPDRNYNAFCLKLFNEKFEKAPIKTIEIMDFGKN